MKIKEITVSMGRKISTAKYENIDLHSSVKIELEQDSETLEAYKKGWEIVNGEIKYQCKEIRERMKPKKLSKDDELFETLTRR